jgi:hypothetical protein
LEVESIDRMYLNLYVPQLQRDLGVVGFFKHHRGAPVASGAVMAPITNAFVAAIKTFVDERGLDLVRFEAGQRKDDVAAEYLAGFDGEEGILFVGVAQEKARVWGTTKRRNPETGATYPWIVRETRIPNAYYFYGVDADFGPFFIKFSSYFPYNGKVVINGNEYAKRQAAKAGIGFESLDNGFAACDDPGRLQRICDGLSAARIDRFVRKWLRLLPHPFTAADRKAGFRYHLSILQAEFSLTQVLDRPLAGRVFFEDVIRHNLDLGRPLPAGWTELPKSIGVGLTPLLIDGVDSAPILMGLPPDSTPSGKLRNAALLKLFREGPLKVLIDNVLEGYPLPPLLAGIAGPLADDRFSLLIMVVVAGFLIAFLSNGLGVIENYVDPLAQAVENLLSAP